MAVKRVSRQRLVSGLLGGVLTLLLTACDTPTRVADAAGAAGPVLDNVNGTLNGSERIDPPKPPLVPQRGAGEVAGRHIALGRLADAQVVVSPADQLETIVARGTSDTAGRFSLNFEAGTENFDSQYLLVRVIGGSDLDADGDGTADTSGTPNQGEWRLLILGRELREKSVSVTVLSDAAFRAVYPFLATLPPSSIRYALDEFAYAVLKDDIDGDGFISYADVVAFNPNRAGDRAKLEIRYDDVYVADGSGQRLIDHYHANRLGDISRRVSEIFSGYLLMDLPDPKTIAKAFATVTVRTTGGGRVTSPQQRRIDVSDEKPEIRLTFDREIATPPFQLVATPDADFRFSRWVGCPQVNADGSCTVDISTLKEQLVSAQFLLSENQLNPNAGLGKEVVLPDAPGVFGVSMTGFEPAEAVPLTQAALADAAAARPVAAKTARTGRIVLSTTLDGTPQSASMRAVIDRIAVNDLVDTGIMDTPLVRVNRIVSPPTAIGSLFYRAVYEVTEMTLLEAYGQFSAEAPDTEIGLDDLTGVSYQDVDAADQLVTLELPARVTRSFIPGPNPSGSDQPLGLCPKDQVYEEIFALEPTSDGRPVVLCIPENVPPLAADENCGSGQTAIEVLDGRRYCVASSAVGNARPESGTAGKPSNTLLIGVDPSPAVSLARRQPAREVFLAGYGRAFDLGNNMYLTKAPQDGGLAIVEATRTMPVYDRAEAQRLQQTTCELNPYAEGCQAWGNGPTPLLSARTASRSGFDIFPSGFGFDLGTENLKAEIGLQLNLNARATGNFNYKLFSFNPYVRANTSGFLRITPSVEVNLVAELGRVWGADGRTADDEDNPSATLERSLFSFDYATKAGGAAAIFTGELRSSMGVEVKGTAQLQNKLRLPIIVSWDGNANISLFGSKDISLAVVPELQFTYVLTGEANLTVEPFLEFAVINGLRAVAPELTKVSLRGFVQGEMILAGPTLSITNEPEQRAIQENKTVCLDGEGGLAFNAYYGLRSELEITTRDQPVDDIVSFSRTHQIGEWKWKFASYGWDFKFSEGKLAEPASESNGFSVTNVADEPEPCTGGLRPENEDYTASTGDLQLRDNAFVATATRQLVMQEDGNLVLYEYDGEAGEQGAPIWATGTNGTFNVRMVYQRDGNLVLYNLRNEPIWASGTQRYPNSELRITADDELQIYDKDREIAVWGYELTQKAGAFTLKPGDYIVTPNRTLYMQRDGNLVLYRFNPDRNRDDPALWASNTSGNSGAAAVFQEDGNLVVYADGGDGRALWASNTGDRARDGTLELTRDGNLELRSASGETVFSTNTAGR